MDLKASAERRMQDLHKNARINLAMQRTASTASNSRNATIRGYGYILPTDAVEEGSSASDDLLLEYIFKLSKIMRFRPGQVIAARGSTEHRLYHVMSGSIVTLSKEGTVLHEARCGQIVGVAAFLDMSNVGQSEVLVTNEETELLVLSLEHVEIISSVQPLSGARFFRNLAIKAELTQQMIVHQLNSRSLGYV
eukprot:CAMPEP_0206236356 /NCGR_PEP_ID=MMETSP0047_2-20121206/13673_1 /ASSEMBLY_ACC=CAM_ASM_000192 /TAXON_ID=195065 /ORGANISM="Chroomonas mesostigmatica_cf, Strain CCMP1168" /LENGTH=192 /DNA_ID=CAMNT_0053660689 /DNA_START=48 /DNA_END=626 /DNA_ORIENTATION=-